MKELIVPIEIERENSYKFINPRRNNTFYEEKIKFKMEYRLIR